MSDAMKESVKRQFGANATLYKVSDVHAKGKDLPLLPDLAGLTGKETLLDVATATGHTAFALAPHCSRVVGVDLTPEMLEEARREAEARDLTNVRFQEADAEHLPFPDHSFDVVTCRIAAHHFPHIDAFCAEAARVLKPGGRLVIIDNVAPEDPALDRFINGIEKRRDPSHFRAHSISEWERYLTGAGLAFRLAHTFTTRMERENWLRRMSVPEDVADELRRLLDEAPSDAKAQYQIDETGFILHKAILIGTKR